MSRRSKKRARPGSRYRPTGIPSLVLQPTVLLLNLAVITFEDDARTDDLIPPETVNKVTALIRQAYDFPDLDREQGKGVGISFIGQFFNPDDYLEHRSAKGLATKRRPVGGADDAVDRAGEGQPHLTNEA